VASSSTSWNGVATLLLIAISFDSVASVKGLYASFATRVRAARTGLMVPSITKDVVPGDIRLRKIVERV